MSSSKKSGFNGSKKLTKRKQKKKIELYPCRRVPVREYLRLKKAEGSA